MNPRTSSMWHNFRFLLSINQPWSLGPFGKFRLVHAFINTKLWKNIDHLGICWPHALLVLARVKVGSNSIYVTTFFFLKKGYVTTFDFYVNNLLDHLIYSVGLCINFIEKETLYRNLHLIISSIKKIAIKRNLEWQEHIFLY